uniref:EOG090X0AQP n=1 Tax=Scapholeberis mucronata TaxID=202097 RepID=A0A4Y7NKR6_9CRUS|nr:EOG090X0AQP [Scapholeberis mucronata]SVE93792.1 EOG090X0AQP [Scapholeberis mucronata]
MMTMLNTIEVKIVLLNVVKKRSLHVPSVKGQISRHQRYTVCCLLNAQLVFYPTKFAQFRYQYWLWYIVEDSIQQIHGALEQCYFLLSNLQLHQQHLNKIVTANRKQQTTDDTTLHEIEKDSTRAPRMFNTCHTCVKRIQSKSLSPNSGQAETSLAKNVVTSLVTTLQNLSNSFRSDQNAYLNKIKSREERSQQYFGGSSKKDWDYDDWTGGSSHVAEAPRVMSQQQLMLQEENTSFVEQREKEIQNVVRSIYELNSIFKEISHMVTDQGTVLDRIDYNIEHTQAKVHDGLVHLQKAESHQKKNRKMVCIVALVSAIIVLLIILIAVKS